MLELIINNELMVQMYWGQSERGGFFFVYVLFWMKDELQMLHENGYMICARSGQH